MNATTTEQVITAENLRSGQLTDRRDWTASVRPDDAFERFFTAHYARLVRTLTAVAGDRDTASDAVQEAFVRAHLRWRKVQTLDDPAGWVRRVAINRLNDHHRRQQRKHRLLGVLSTRHQTSIEEPPIDEVERLLAALPRQQRAVTAMFYVDGLPVADIAAALGLSVGSVKSHLHDARQSLRRVLGTDGSTPAHERHSPIDRNASAATPSAPSVDNSSSPWSRP